ncbi:MAG: alpha/beta hydrolase [Actinobacteria bacterium]|nr:alpha/beta hydrolase [Actinomycetota bacterium]
MDWAARGAPVTFGNVTVDMPVDCAHRLTDDIPGADRHVIADAGHFCMEDQPDTVAQFVGQPRDDG